MTLSDFLHHKREVINKLKGKPKSQARDLLVNLLKLPNATLITAVYDQWFFDNYGVRPFGSTVSIPKVLMPKMGDPMEFYQYITDELKRSI